MLHGGEVLTIFLCFAVITLHFFKSTIASNERVVGVDQSHLNFLR
jgi:hypothetical protein